MGLGSSVLTVLGLFPWSAVAFVSRAFLPKVAGPVMMGASAVLLVLGAASTARQWLRRQYPGILD